MEYIDMLNRKKLNVNGEMIVEVVKRLWSLMPEYCNVVEPKWSTGWLLLFKKMYKIKSWTLYDEAESVDVEKA